MENSEIEEINELREKCIELIKKNAIGDSPEHGYGALSLLCIIAEKAKVAIRNKDMSYMAYKAATENK